MSMRKLVFDDDAVYAGVKNGFKFWWEDWMDDYTYHPNQKELIVRYELAKSIGANRSRCGMNSGLDLYNALTGHRFYGRTHCDLRNELDKDFPHYRCLDHTVTFKNTHIGEVIVTSLVYLDSRELIKASCDKWGWKVGFIPYEDPCYDGNPYHWMYVVYWRT